MITLLRAGRRPWLWPASLVLAALALLVVCGAGTASAAPAPAPPTPIPAPVTTSPLPGIYGPGFTPDSTVPAPTGPVPGDDLPPKSDPGIFDIPGQIEQAVDEWFGQLVKLALDPVLKLLGATLLSSPDLTDGRIVQIWDGCLITANTVYVLFVLLSAVTVMGFDTVQTRHSVKEFAPRLVIGAIASNASLWVVNQIISLANALSSALMTGRTSAEGVGKVLTSVLLGNVLYFGSGNLFLLFLGLAIAVLGVVLLIVYLARSAILVVLVVGAPLAFACHAHPLTEGLANLWWRAIFGCAAVQVLQALVLITAVQIFFDPGATDVIGLPTGSGLMDLLVCLCLFVVLLKIPGWVQRIVLRRSFLRPSRAGRMVQGLVYYRTLGFLRQASRSPRSPFPRRSGFPMPMTPMSRRPRASWPPH